VGVGDAKFVPFSRKKKQISDRLLRRGTTVPLLT